MNKAILYLVSVVCFAVLGGRMWWRHEFVTSPYRTRI